MRHRDLLQARLQAYDRQGLLRRLRHEHGLVDFSSNDYLGMARSEGLHHDLLQRLAAQPQPTHGGGSSRLISGNHAYMEAVENRIARYHQAEAGLIFGSGFAANNGLMASLARKGDALISDELVHASIIDGIRLSYAERHIFRHNDLEDLEAKLRQSQHARARFIVVESIYSMDGDMAPLQEMAALAGRYEADLVVDEAHATGMFGEKGEGRVVELGLADEVLARVHTFGKGLGVHGAIVLGPQELRDYLVNFARPFIYTTAPPLHVFVAVEAAYHWLEQHLAWIPEFHQAVDRFRTIMSASGWETWLPSQSGIQSLIIPGNERVREVGARLLEQGFYVKPIVSPTVPVGKERLRFCVHRYNSPAEMEALAACLRRLREA